MKYYTNKNGAFFRVKSMADHGFMVEGYHLGYKQWCPYVWSFVHMINPETLKFYGLKEVTEEETFLELI